MCQMRIILKQDDQEKTLLENAAFLSVTDDGITVNALLEKPHHIRGVKIESMDFLESRLMLRKC